MILYHYATVAELADAQRSGRCSGFPSASSTLVSGRDYQTIKEEETLIYKHFFLFLYLYKFRNLFHLKHVERQRLKYSIVCQNQVGRRSQHQQDLQPLIYVE